MFHVWRAASKTLLPGGPVHWVCSITAELLLGMCMSKKAQSFSWRSSLLGFSLMPQSLPPQAKAVPSIVLQRYCPSHDPKQSCLMFWEDNPKLCALIALWKTLSQVMGLMPVKFNGKTAYPKTQVGYCGLLESHRACQTLELNSYSLCEMLAYERTNLQNV